MQEKKNPSKNLEQFRFVFFQIGMILSLTAVIVVMKWTRTSSISPIISSVENIEVDLIDVRNTFVQAKEMPNKVVFKKKKIDPKPDPDPKPRKRKTIIIPSGNPEFGEGNEWDSTALGTSFEKPEPVNYFLVEKFAIFPGCEQFLDNEARSECFHEAFQKFILENVKYPEMAKSMGIQGKVYVTFIIGEDGYVRDVSLGRGIDKYLDAEAIRVVKRVPKMEPASQRGMAVPVIMTLPINFRLN